LARCSLGGPVGEGTAHLFDARAALDFGVAWLEDRFAR
jgi:hypothetical protein